jgi:hypothetical protein
MQDANAGRPPAPPRGLCDGCAHQQLVPNTRGSVFSLCLRSRQEPERFRRYPQLPVLDCDGYEARKTPA